MEIHPDLITQCSRKDLMEIESEENPIVTRQIEALDPEAEKYFVVTDTKGEENHEIEVSQDEQTVEELEERLSSFSEFCRTCANVSDHLIPIFEGEGLQNDLCTKIHKYLPIQLSMNDVLPLQLCYQCAAALLAWHELSEGCLTAEHKLQNMYESLQKKQEYLDVASSEELQVPQGTVTIPTPAEAVNSPHGTNKDEENDEATVSDSERWQAECSGNVQIKSVIENAITDIEEVQSIECTQCDVAFTNVPSFVTHMNRMHEIELHYCSYCKVMYRSPVSDFEEHLSLHKDKSYVGKDFNEEDKSYGCHNDADHDCLPTGDFRMKSVKSAEGLDYACSKCSESFENKFDLKKHIISHSYVKRIQNPEEIEMVDSARQMINERVTYKCDLCEKLMFTKRGFLRHIRVHSDKRPCKCEHCGKCYRIEQDLARHIRDVHKGLKKYACDICGRTFANKGTKDDHRRIHTGERPYTCEHCPKTFRTLNSIYIHNRVHNNYKPHKCSHCGKLFGSRQRLNNHMTTHTGVKAFPCEICGKLFSVKGEVMRHLAVHKQEKPFDCKCCGMKFGQKRYLKNHIKQHHKEKAFELLSELLENMNVL